MKKQLLFCICALICFLPQAYCAEATSSKDVKESAQSLPVGAEKIVADFESGGTNPIMNSLNGESGAWNMDVTDENNAYCDIDIAEIPDRKGNPTKALRLAYSVESSVPAQNGFWTKLLDFDASTYDHLQLDVRGDAEKGFTEKFKIELKKFKDLERTQKIQSSREIPVTNEWQTVSIPLNQFTGLIDFADPEAWKNPAIARTHLDEFVVAFKDRHVTKKTGVIYIDNVKFVKTGKPGPSAVDFPPRQGEKTPVRLEGLEFAKFLIKRLGGFPEKLIVKKEFPDDPKAFLMEIAKDTWHFFDDIVDKEHGLPLDTIQLGKKKVMEEGTWIGDYTNVTNIGVYLMCVVSAYDLGFITKEDAVARLRLTMNTVEKLEHHKSGFPYNYYDTTTLERTSYFVSLVDSGWLTAGLYVVKNAFPQELAAQAERMIKRGNFNFFYDPVDSQMFHGYYDHLEVFSDYHYGVFYSEPRATSYMAVSRGDVPEEHWFEGLARTFPEEFAWQQQIPTQRVKRTSLGHSYYGGYYEWKGLKYVPSWGGSAFEALMPPLVLKEKELGPEGLGANDFAHVMGQIRFATEELGYPVWGMSPSSVPEGGYSEYGATPFGSKGYKVGVVTPHASILALDFAPEEVIKNLRKLIELYEIYGEYGFYDAVTVETGLVAHKYLALDQGMIFIAINNYLNQGAIRERFHSDSEMRKGENLLASEKFFEEPSKELAPGVASAGAKAAAAESQKGMIDQKE